jgi:hypothetical protein
MTTIQDFKSYISFRNTLRIYGFGYNKNPRKLNRTPLKLLKGLIKQSQVLAENHEYHSEIPMIIKEIEFRELCLSFKSVFDIELK